MSDLISRQDAIDAIDYYLGEVKNIPMGTAFKEGVKDGYCRIRSIIMSLPPADIHLNDTYMDTIKDRIRNLPWAHCPMCNQSIEYPLNYCPNCGADMRGDEDGKVNTTDV